VPEDNPLDAEFFLQFLLEFRSLQVLLSEEGPLPMGFFIDEKITLKGFHRVFAEER
jgi:hypothetical protein